MVIGILFCRIIPIPRPSCQSNVGKAVDFVRLQPPAWEPKDLLRLRGIPSQQLLV